MGEDVTENSSRKKADETAVIGTDTLKDGQKEEKCPHLKASAKQRTDRKKTGTLMLEGPIWKNILLFSLPLMLGNLFQQLYNTVDSIVVGNFVGKEALAAVGSVDSVINTFIGFFSGLATGAGVVISQYYGAQDGERVHDSVHTALALTLLMSVVCTVCALLLVEPLLHLMGTPDDVWDQAASYLRVYFAGVTGLLFYNMGAGILRAVGDSRRPLYFLMFSALLNIALDLLFVAVIRMSVRGAACATIISQGSSALLCLFVLSHERDSYRVSLRDIRLNRRMTRRIFSVGLPTALQMAVTSFSNVFVQSYVNSFGSAAMAGWSSYGKIDKVLMLPVQSVGMGVTTFVGQNLGAGKMERVRQSTKNGIKITFSLAVLMIIPIWIFAGNLVSLFNQDPEVLAYGKLLLRLMLPFYFALCINQVYAGALRGIGNTRAPMIIMMCSFILFRQAYLFVISRLTDTIVPVALGYPFGWMVCSAALVFYYYKCCDMEKYRRLYQQA